MASLVLDASIILALALPDESDPVAERAVKRMLRGGALVPCHWLVEVGNGLLMAERRQRISAAIRNSALAYIASLPFEVDDRLRDIVWSAAAELAASHRLTLYDGVYLELAARSGLPLATLDKALCRAAKKERVPLVE
jgi:predicted nucleic acid-binding protein